MNPLTPLIQEALWEMEYHAIPNLLSDSPHIKCFMATDSSHRLRISTVLQAATVPVVWVEGNREMSGVFSLQDTRRIISFINFLVDKGYNPALAYRRYRRLRALLDD